MSDILCLYYSRSGNTRQTMAEIAEALEAELVEFTDGAVMAQLGAPDMRIPISLAMLSPWRNTDW